MVKAKTKGGELKRSRRLFGPASLAFILVFGAIGGYAIYKSFAAAPGPPGSCTQTISSGTNLGSTVTNATGGAVICLNSGSYSVAGNDLYGVHKSDWVTIKPASGATVNLSLTLWGVQYMRFTGLGGTLNISGLYMSSGNSDSSLGHGPLGQHVEVDHANFTGTAQLDPQDANLDWTIDSNTFYDLDAGTYEGRLSVRGYDVSANSGITISNNKFGQGGCSDGVQVIGSAYGVVIGPGNEFSHIDQGGCSSHNDPIQFYGADHTVVTGNYFHDNAGSGGLESFDGNGEHTTVTNNVFECTCGYPWSVAAFSGQGWLVQHNTFANGGSLGFQLSGNGLNPSGNIVKDNIFAGGGSIQGIGSWGTSDHNLNAGVSGTGNISGTPTFVGGANPTTYAGFALTSSSVGHNAASDGTDMGANVNAGGSGGGGTPPPTVSLTANPSSVIVGNSSTLAWSTSDATSCTASGAWSGSKATSGSQSTGSLSSSATYSLSCSGAGGTGSASTTVTVSQPGDVTIGETKVLTSGDSGNANLLIAQNAPLSQAATVKSLSFYVTNAAGKLRLGIYDSSGAGGGPGTLKAQTAEITPVSGWNTANVTSQVSLPAGTYWLAYLPSDNSLSFEKAEDGSSSGKYYSYAYGSLPNTFSASPSSTTSHWSFYATLNTGSLPNKPGDVNGDGSVNVFDLSILLSNYGKAGNSGQGDLNNDGQVNVLDLSILLSNYGA